MRWHWRDGTHDVVLDYNYLLSTKKLTVDGKSEPIKANMAMRWEHGFDVGNQPARVTFALRYFVVPSAELDIGERVIEPALAPPKPAPWVWAFVTANLAMLVLSKGGAIPGAIAGVGAVSCIGASMTQRSELIRLALCAVATAAAWGLFYALLLAAR